MPEQIDPADLPAVVTISARACTTHSSYSNRVLATERWYRKYPPKLKTNNTINHFIGSLYFSITKAKYFRYDEVVQSFFGRIASQVSKATGSAYAFVSAICLILAWIVTGPIFNFSDTWQLVINTLTTIVTFLMVFMIQNTQNRDTKAVHLKLDELIRAEKNARDRFMEIEESNDEDLEKMRREFQNLQQKALMELERRRLQRRRKYLLASRQNKLNGTNGKSA